MPLRPNIAGFVYIHSQCMYAWSARFVHDVFVVLYHLLETAQVVQPHQVNQILGTVEGKYEVHSQ